MEHPEQPWTVLATIELAGIELRPGLLIQLTRSDKGKQDNHTVRLLEIREQDGERSLVVYGGRGFPDGNGKWGTFDVGVDRFESVVIEAMRTRKKEKKS